MSRWKAGAIHFSISLLVFLLLLSIILLVWFPGILFVIDGGWSGLRIVIGVDLVLGPLLTLIVFKSGKPGLKFDLGCIAVFQVSCMIAGMWIVYKERPLALVLAYDTFYSLSAKEFEDYDRDSELLKSFPGSYPKLIYIELPENEISAEIALIRSQFIGDPLFMQTENYQSLENSTEPLESIFRKEESVREAVSLELLGQLNEQCHLAKFQSSKNSGYVCYEHAEGFLTEFFGGKYSRTETQP